MDVWNREQWSIFWQAIAALGSMVAASQIFFLVQQLKDNRKLAQDQNAVSFWLSPEFNNLEKTAREELLKWDIVLRDQWTAMPESAVHSLQKDPQAYMAVIDYLSILERLAASVSTRAVSAEAERRVGGYYLVAAYGLFLPLILARRRATQRATLYVELQVIARRWDQIGVDEGLPALLPPETQEEREARKFFHEL